MTNHAINGNLIKMNNTLLDIVREFKKLNRHIGQLSKNTKRLGDLLEQSHKPIIVYDIKNTDFT